MRDVDALREEVARGLSASPPMLPPKWFYDEEGGRLFEEITRLPEYYLTRTEMRILHDRLPRIAEFVGDGGRVVEFGSGSGRKAELLLEALKRPSVYVPVDVAEKQLRLASERVAAGFPDLHVAPLVADFSRRIQLPEVQARDDAQAGRPLLFFPGSTIGNFEPEDARSFLEGAGSSLGPGAVLVVGFDLVKAREILEAAYDDAGGVTAGFNVNALRHLNRVLHTDFRIECFHHRAVWNREASRIEMHLVALADQVVWLPSASGGAPRIRLRLRAGEHVVTEHSYKYTLKGFRTLLEAAGWEAVEVWTDPRMWFAVGMGEWKGAG